MHDSTDERGVIREASTQVIGRTFPGKLAWLGISSITIVGLIHLFEAPEHLEEATYLGLLFFANFGAAAVAAIGIYRNHGWGWALGTAVAGGAFLGYVFSRTIGLPGVLVEDWLEPLGKLSLLVEGLFVGAAVFVLQRRREWSK